MVGVPQIVIAKGDNAKTIISHENIKTKKYLNELNQEIACPKILYFNSSGTAGTIVLNDDISNYNFVEIYYCDDWGNMNCEKVNINYSAYIETSLSINRIADKNLSLRSTLININGTVLEPRGDYLGTFNSWNNELAYLPNIFIKYIYGYK